jgi:hypothetical protein
MHYTAFLGAMIPMLHSKELQLNVHALNRADVMKGLEQRTKKIQEAYTCKVLASESKFKAALERWTMTTSKRNALSIQKRKARKVAADAVVRAKKGR